MSGGTGGGTDLAALLREMRPERRPGEYVVVSLPAEHAALLPAQATIVEDEGVTVVLRREHAAGLASDYVAAWITLTVHSSLAAVGLTAAVATALADAGISCNVLAGAVHDHLLVPVDRADEALRVLARLSASAPDR